MPVEERRSRRRGWGPTEQRAEGRDDGPTVVVRTMMVARAEQDAAGLVGWFDSVVILEHDRARLSTSAEDPGRIHVEIGWAGIV